MLCKFCGAQGSDYFHNKQCRRCINFQKNTVVLKKPSWGYVALNIPFPLTPQQKDVSQELLKMESDKNIFLEAVCGAGKTEVCLELLTQKLNDKKRCCWAIPRREIVLELKERLQTYYPSLKVIAVCKGHTTIVEGDLIVLTTHQLYRYPKTFDFMILDEPDAFPFSNNQMLAQFVSNALTINPQILYLSATTDEKIEKEIKEGTLQHLNLPIRPSLKALPVPIWRLSLFIWIKFYKDLKNHKEDKNLIFVPTIKLAKQLSLLLKSPYVCSESENKNELIEKFRELKKGNLITTTILERGVTFPDCMVFVLFADHIVFTKSSLIQIAGRVQRGLNPQKGVCYFYSEKKSEVIQSCIQAIQRNNYAAHSVLNQCITQPQFLKIKS